MHVVVDGYNVMHALPVEEEWPGRTFQDRRHAFLDRLAAYGGGRTHRFTVVFDGTRGGDEMGGAETWRGIDVRYSPRGVEADRVLLDLVERDSRPAELLVVSSDRRVADRARSLGASTARADELIGRLRPGRTGPPSGREHGRRAGPLRHRPSRQRLNLW